MDTHHFPNGFSSWQKTHFEVVEVLVYMRNLQEGKVPRPFAELIDKSATEELYRLAISLTDKFEEQTIGKIREKPLFDDIEEFVWNELQRL